MGAPYNETSLALNYSGSSNYLLDGTPVKSDLIPASLIKLDDSQEHIIWVEMEKGLLHLMVPNQTNGNWQIGFTRPISIGKAGYGKEVEAITERQLAYIRSPPSFLTKSLLIITATVLSQSIIRIHLTDYTIELDTGSGCTACLKASTYARCSILKAAW